MERITFAFIASSSLIIPVICGLFLYRNLNKVLRGALLYLMVALLFQVVSSLLVTYNVNNLPVLHLYTVVRFGFLSWIFIQLLDSSFLKRVIFANVFFLLFFSIGNSWLFQSLFEFNTNTLTIEGILLIIYSVLYLFQILRQLKIREVEKHFSFWLVSGILYYFAGNFFLFNLSNFLLEIEPFKFSEYWHIHSVNLLLFYTAFTVALLQRSGRKSETLDTVVPV